MGSWGYMTRKNMKMHVLERRLRRSLVALLIEEKSKKRSRLLWYGGMADWGRPLNPPLGPLRLRQLLRTIITRSSNIDSLTQSPTARTLTK